MAHAKLSPSSSSRWMVCTASIGACEGLPGGKASIHSARGTVLHWLSSVVLETGKHLNKVGDVIMQDGFEVKLTQADLDQVEVYVDYVLTQQANATGKLVIERKFDLTSFIPEGFGTGDATIIEPAREIHVIDAKFGSGIKVFAADNTQLLIYGLGAWIEFAEANFVEQLRCTIVQPPLNHIDTVVYTIPELKAWLKRISTQAMIAYSGDGAEYVPGDHCRFCPAKPNCKALKELAQQKARDIFAADNDAPSLAAGIKDLGDEMALVTALESWIKAIKDEARARLLDGMPVAGFKLVQGRRTRKWLDEDAVEKFLRSKKVKVADIFDTKLRSVAQMEKVVPEDIELIDYIETKAGSPTVAPESDRRKAITSSANVIFQ